MRKLLRTVVALVALAEAFAFFVGTALHLGVPLPVPYVESTHMSSVLVETASGVLLVIAAAAIFTHRRRAWQIAVGAHVAGVVSIAYGIATRGSSVAMQPSHHRPMLVLVIAALVALATPPIRNALEIGRRRHRHRRHRHQVMQSL